MADEERLDTCPCDAEDDEMTMAGALHVELNHLWCDLFWALRSGAALDSSRVESLEWRIRLLSRLAGPTPWGHIDVLLLRNGTYARIYQDVEYPPIDWERVAEMEARIEAQRARHLR